VICSGQPPVEGIVQIWLEPVTFVVKAIVFASGESPATEAERMLRYRSTSYVAAETAPEKTRSTSAVVAARGDGRGGTLQVIGELLSIPG
jgi:hypothetical protein